MRFEGMLLRGRRGRTPKTEGGAAVAFDPLRVYVSLIFLLLIFAAPASAAPASDGVLTSAASASAADLREAAELVEWACPDLFSDRLAPLTRLDSATLDDVEGLCFCELSQPPSRWSYMCTVAPRRVTIRPNPPSYLRELAGVRLTPFTLSLLMGEVCTDLVELEPDASEIMVRGVVRACDRELEKRHEPGRECDPAVDPFVDGCVSVCDPDLDRRCLRAWSSSWGLPE